MSENDLENQATSSEKNNVQLEDNLTKPMGVFNYIGTLILFKDISIIYDFHILKSYIIYHSYDLNKITCPCFLISYINRMI